MSPRTERVDFVVAGAQKSGTTALRKFLSEHPQIGVPLKGECHFFSARGHKTDPADYRAYHALFSKEGLAKCTGDFTPVYLYYKEVPARIHTYNADMKIIVLLRDPTERAYSQWAMNRERGHAGATFVGALLMEPLYWLRRGQDGIHSYMQRGFYAHQLKRLFRYFPRENCLILRSEDLLEHHETTLKRVHAFLGVDPAPIPARKIVHARHYATMSPAVRYFLRMVFYRDIKQLERILGWECGAWLGLQQRDPRK